jgi:hypothetical protein
MAKVQGTQTARPAALEFGTDTVYERANITRVTGDERHGDYWEYDETQYTYPEYTAKQQEYTAKQQEQLDNTMLALAELAEISAGG